MATKIIKINNKSYKVPELKFEHMEALESEGFNIIDMFRKKQLFAPVSAFIMVVVGCEKEEANYLAEQHVLGGGNLNELYEAFSEALYESAFFRKVLGIEDEKPAKKVTKASTTKEKNEE